MAVLVISTLQNLIPNLARPNQFSIPLTNPAGAILLQTLIQIPLKFGCQMIFRNFPKFSKINFGTAKVQICLIFLKIITRPYQISICNVVTNFDNLLRGRVKKRLIIKHISLIKILSQCFSTGVPFFPNVPTIFLFILSPLFFLEKTRTF